MFSPFTFQPICAKTQPCGDGREEVRNEVAGFGTGVALAMRGRHARSMVGGYFQASQLINEVFFHRDVNRVGYLRYFSGVTNFLPFDNTYNPI